MAYGRYRRRRSYNRRRRSLSNRNVFAKTSAKSQARQIAALRNRINSVYRRTKPEIKTIVTGAETFKFTSESLSSYYHFYSITYPEQGTADKERVGNFVRVINGVLYLSCEYFNSSQTGYHDTESSGAQVRVIIGQWKARHSGTTTPSIQALFEFPSNTGANYTQMALSPLKEGISGWSSILKDYRFTMTVDRNQKMLKIPFKPRIPYVFDDANEFPSTWVCLLVTGLHYDTDFTETVNITASDKLVFTDA